MAWNQGHLWIRLVWYLDRDSLNYKNSVWSSRRLEKFFNDQSCSLSNRYGCSFSYFHEIKGVGNTHFTRLNEQLKLWNVIEGLQKTTVTTRITDLSGNWMSENFPVAGWHVIQAMVWIPNQNYTYYLFRLSW